MNGLIQMLPVIASVVFIGGGLSYVVAKMYDLGALQPEPLSVRKSAQTRFTALARALGLAGATGLAALVLSGLLTEVIQALLGVTAGLGVLAFLAGEIYAGSPFGLGHSRESALRPIGRRFGAFGLAAGLTLAGYTLAALASVVGLAGYTVYAAYKSD